MPQTTHALIEITDPRLAENRKQNAEVVAKMAMAAREDYKDSPYVDGSFSARAFDRDFARAFPRASNSTPLATAMRYWNVTYGTANGNAATLSGEDTYRVAAFFFRNRGVIGWPKVEQVLRDAGPPYEELLSLKKQPTPEERYQVISTQKVADLVPNGSDPAQVLREVADQIDQMRTHLTISEKTNKSLVEEQTKLRRRVAQAREAISRLVARLKDEQDPEKRQELAKQIEELNRMLDNLI